MRALLKAWELLKPDECGVCLEACTLCGFPLQVRLRRDELGVRCPYCGASAITQSLADVVRHGCGDLSALDAYELSAQGPLVRWLRRRTRSLVTSEYVADVTPGSLHDGVRCEDVQRLTFAAASFDLCTSTEVFEHVEDDMAGFREIHRVLRPGGWFVFSVPLDVQGTTLERTAIHDGRRVAVLPAEYHADRYRGRHVFCYRNYGADIVARLAAAGFVEAGVHRPRSRLFGHARPIVVARRARA